MFLLILKKKVMIFHIFTLFTTTLVSLCVRAFFTFLVIYVLDFTKKLNSKGSLARMLNYYRDAFLIILNKKN